MTSTSTSGLPDRLVIGSRRSSLARAQADRVAARLVDAWPGLTVSWAGISTEGDRRLDASLPAIGGKGVFTAELERALLEGRIDIAVHSLKDLPTEQPADLAVAAIPPREDPRDLLIVGAGEASLEGLAEGASVGTSSVRRAAQLGEARPDVRVVPIRGNVETRLSRIEAGEVDAVVLAAAGLARLGIEPARATLLELEAWLPAAGQGALAVQIASARRDVARAARAIECPHTRAEVTAERGLLSELGAGCHAPVGASARVRAGSVTLRAVVYDPRGREEPLRGSTEGPVERAEELGRALAEVLLGPRGREWLSAPPAGSGGPAVREP